MIYIQILRGIAATMVVLFHSLGTAHHYVAGTASPLLHLSNGGGVGVDIFFVISGFIICDATLRNPPRPGDFLRKRLIRIVPLYWLLTALMAGLMLVAPGMFHSQGGGLPLKIAASFLFVSFLVDHFPVVYVGWSLEYELLFYLAVALLLLGGAKVWSRLIAGFAGLVLLGQVLPPVGDDTLSGAVQNFLVNPRILEFVFGVVAACIHRRLAVAHWALALALAALATIVWHAPASVVPSVGLPATLLVLAAARFSPRETPRSRLVRCAAAVGDSSYSIYLVQVFVISAACKAFARLSMPIDLVVLGATVTVIGAGCGLYRIVEQPMLQAMRRRMRATDRADAGPSGAITSLLHK